MSAPAIPNLPSRRKWSSLIWLSIVGSVVLTCGRASAVFGREQAALLEALEPAIDDLKVKIGTDSLQKIIADPAWLLVLGEELQWYVRRPDALVTEAGGGEGFCRQLSGPLYSLDVHLKTMAPFVPEIVRGEPPVDTLDLRVMASMQRASLVFWGAPKVRLAAESKSLPSEEVEAIHEELVRLLGARGFRVVPGIPNLF